MRRIYNLLLVMIMVFNVIAPCTVTALELTEKVYTYNDYIIAYNIIGSWTNNQNINITVSNIGDESIVGWALKYDAGGEINGLWNGAVYNCNETEYIIKSTDYNNVIEPDSSVTFGYTLTGDNLVIPENIEFCLIRIVNSDEYEVEFTETNDFGASFQGEIKISNLTDEPIESWTLTFDSNFVIKELSGAKIISQNNNTYKASDQQWAAPIQPDSTVVFGLSGSKEENVQPEIKNIVLSEIVFDDKSIPNIPDIPDDPDISYGDDDGIYCKPLTSIDEIAYKDSGFTYVRNQILVMADDSISFEEMSDIADNLNADIVGYFDITNEYQIEFRYNIELDDLENIIDDLEQKSFIKYAALNYAYDLQVDVSPNDNKTSISSKINNNDWNYYTINAFRAWEYYDEIVDIPYVNIGVLDTVFAKKDAVEYVKFEKILKSANINGNNINENNWFHGTFVAGIIGAESNNEFGIKAICPKSKLYAYGICPTWWQDTFNIPPYSAAAEIKQGLYKLITADAKVINVSLGTLNGDSLLSVKSGSISEDLQKDFKKGAEVFAESLDKLLYDDKYDFTIVVAAGNDEVESKYSIPLNYIDDSSIENHIIVVGAIEMADDNDYKLWHDEDMGQGSNWGEGVDVVAPGKKIYGIMPDNSDAFANGTSVASPQVAGIAGMMYAVNPNIKGNHIKAIIKKSSNINTVTDDHGYTYGIVDARLAVSTAYYIRSESTQEIVFGTLKDFVDKEKNTATLI